MAATRETLVRLRISKIHDTYIDGVDEKPTPITIDREGRANRICAQTLSNPGVLDDGDRKLVLCYGDHSLPDQRQGDGVYVLEILPNGSFRRHTRAALAFPHELKGGYGVGASGWVTEEKSRYGFRYFAAVPLVMRPGPPHSMGWGMSRDGINWLLLADDGSATWDPRRAATVLSVGSEESRFWHQATYQHDGWLYLFTGYQRPPAFTIQLYRWRYEKHQLYGITRGAGSTLERWSYVAGDFERFSGVIGEEDDKRFRRYGLWEEAIDPMDSTIITDASGHQSLLVIYGSNRNTLFDWPYSYRISSTLEPPYDWSPMRHIDSTLLRQHPLVWATAGGPYLAVYQDGLQDNGLPRLRGLVALADRNCHPEPQGQSSGLYPIDLELTL